METSRRLTIDQVIEYPWKYEASQYQAVMGVKQPWIAEISPMQHSHLSKRGKAAYDSKRSQEWEASSSCKQEWRDRVIAAYDADAFTLDDPSVTREAKSAVYAALSEREQRDVHTRLADALRRNKITSIDQVNIGDRVFSVLGRWYGRVVKKSKVSVRIEVENPPAWMQGKPPMKCNLVELQWQSYNDVKATVSPGTR